MYHHIKGMVHSLKPSTAVIENGGIGYLLKISLNTYASLKQGFESTVFTHLVVREDSQTLFGFSDIEERDMFLTLLGVGGVGPGNAINVLSYMKPSAIERAASSEDKAAFRAVKGVGEKLSAQLVLDLKGKFKADNIEKSQQVAQAPDFQDAVSALVSLGFTKQASKTAVDESIAGGAIGLQNIISAALKIAK